MTLFWPIGHLIAETWRLLLPVIFPSWRFFKDVGPSPRVQYRLLEKGAAQDWRDAWPRPDRVRPGEMARRLFWNAEWNAYLFSVTCAERLIEGHKEYFEDMLTRLVAARVAARPGSGLQIRVVMLERKFGGIERTTAYMGAPVST